MGNWFRDNWEIISVLAVALITWGTLQARVSALEEKAAVATTDHDILVKVSTQQDTMQKQLDRIETGLVQGTPGGIR
jgi:hypothetical protein